MKVALIGLDGSGKSANMNIMKDDKEYSSFNFLWVRWQPSVTMVLYKIKHRNDVVGVRQDSEAGKKKQVALNKEYSRKKKIKDKLFKNAVIRKLWMKYAIFDYRKQFEKKTKEYLIADSDIIFDRFYLDLFIDQGINFGYSPEKIYDEIQKNQKYFPVMDKTIYIRVSPEVCYARKDDIPNMDYLIKRYEIYEYIAQKQKWIVINGELPLEEVYANIKQNVLK